MTDYEAAYVRAALDLEEAKWEQGIAQLRAENEAGLAQLREGWSSGVVTPGGTSLDEVQRSIEARKAETREWIRVNYVDGPDEPSTPETAQRGQSGTPTGSDLSALPVNRAPAGLPMPGAVANAEQAEAERIKGLSMTAFAAERQALGADRGQANGLFGPRRSS